MPVGSSWLSNKTQVPIILVHTRLDKGPHITIKFEKPIYPSSKRSKKEILLQSQKVFSEIERIIKSNPISWCGYDTFDKMIV